MSKFKILTSVFALSAHLVAAECPKCGHEGVKEMNATNESSVYISKEGLTDGFYVGLSGGLMRDMGKEDLLVHDNTFDPQMNATQKLKKTSLIGGASGGYMRVFPNTFMALEVEVTGPQHWSKDNTVGQFVPGSHGGVLQTSSPVTMRYRQDFAVALIQKFGWRFTPSTAAYLRAGPVMGQFSWNGRIAVHPGNGGGIRIADNALLKRRKKVLGLDLGVGVVHQFADSWMGSVYLSHRRFQKIKYDFEPGGAEATKIKINPKQTRLMMTVSYKI